FPDRRDQLRIGFRPLPLTPVPQANRPPFHMGKNPNAVPLDLIQSIRSFNHPFRKHRLHRANRPGLFFACPHGLRPRILQKTSKAPPSSIYFVQTVLTRRFPMFWSWKNRWNTAALYTAVAVNLMLTALILVRHYWAAPVEVPSMARPENPSYRQ